MLTILNAPTLRPLMEAKRGWISQVVWSPNGKLIAASGAGGVVVYRGSLSAPPVFIKGHSGPVKGLAFAPNGTTLATASADTTVKVWDLRAVSPTMQPMTVFEDHTDAVEKVLFAANGLVISCSVDGTIRVEVRGERRRVLGGHTDEVNAIAIQGRTLASGGHDKTVRLWDWTTGEAIAALEGHADWVRKLAFNGDHLLSASRDGTVRVWNIGARETVGAYAHRGDVRALAVDASGEIVATSSIDGAIQLWAFEDGAHLGTLEDHTMPVLTLAFHPQNALLASGGGDNRMVVWGVEG